MGKLINIGEMDRYVELHSFTETANAAGQPVKTWSKTADIWVKLQPKGGGEAYENDQLTATNRYEFITWYRSDVDATKRIIEGSEIYRITHVEEYTLPEGHMSRQKFLSITCEKIDHVRG